MKKLLCALVAGIVSLSGGTASGQEEGVSIDVGTDWLSGYIWRGQVLGSDNHIVLQPNASITFGESGFAVGLWGSFFLAKIREDRFDPVDELDYFVSYDRALGESFGVSLGYTQYSFPNVREIGAINHSEEFWVGLSMNNVFAPSVTYFYDFGIVDAYYLTAGIAPEFKLREDEDASTLSLGASIAFSGEGYGGSSGFNDLTITVALNKTMGRFTFSPTVGVAMADDSVNPDDATFWYGLLVAF